MAYTAEGARGDGGAAEVAAPPPTRRKIRPEAVWAEARKAWEAGETARSVARRYDVGVPALWKRREAEGWKRPDPAAGPSQPAPRRRLASHWLMPIPKDILGPTSEAARESHPRRSPGPLQASPSTSASGIANPRATSRDRHPRHPRPCA